LTRKSSFEDQAKSRHFGGFGTNDPGQNYPQEYPHPDDSEMTTFRESLGAPLSIREVARLVGCSAWTIRHRYLAAGLPHVRIGSAGKLIFYTNQVVRWLLRQQQKGGMIL
jgi:hypothetical protein